MSNFSKPCFKTLFVALILVILSSEKGRCEEDHSPQCNSRSSLYLEAFGPGGFGSLNYELAFFNVQKNALSCRLGLGFLNFMDVNQTFNPDIIVPFGFHYAYGAKHKIKIGGGESLSSVMQFSSNDGPKRTNSFNTFLTLQYQWTLDSGLFLFLGYTPIIQEQKHFKNWAGFGLGYEF